ncbi:MAG: glutathionylspermidine synthase family protein [Candidatus Schekmanbacteria bacterium]|nr:glutathionylspermidine synthase family protein [Candidatus Schekmanbacteria bacterium]
MITDEVAGSPSTTAPELASANPASAETPPSLPAEMPRETRQSRHLEQALRFADEDLIEWMRRNPKELLDQRQACLRLLMKRRCAYGRSGGALPLMLTPMILTRQSVDFIAKATEILDRCIDKAINAYLRDPAVREQIPCLEIPKEWVEWDPGYPKPTVVSRHDAFFDGKTLKFLEFNTDNPGARVWADTYEEVYRTMPMYADLFSHTKRYDRRQMHALLEIFRRYWKDYGGGGTGAPRVALTSFKEYLPGSEWEILRDFLIEHGMEANFIDSREFEYRNGKLYSGNVRLDFLHLCLRFVFFKRFPREHQDFYGAIRDRAVLSINPFRASVGSQKEIMSFLTNPDNHHHFTEEEVEAIKAHIPWTRRLDETITISPDGRDIALIDFVYKNKDRLVLKIASGAGGQDVHVGKAEEEGQWHDLVDSVSGMSWWIVQEACDVPEFELPVLKDSKVVLEKKNVNLNPYVFDGKYVGSVCRTSDSKVINVAAGGGIMPVLEAQ